MRTGPRARRANSRERAESAELPVDGGAPPDASASAPPAPDEDLTRVSFYMRGNEPVWDRMHASTREKVERLRGGSGDRASGASALDPVVSKALAGAVVASVPVFLQIGLRLLGFTAESVARVQLDERTRAELAPLYAAALADYNVMLGRHENLIVALGMTGLALAPAFEKLERAKKPNGSAGAPLVSPLHEQIHAS